MCKGGGESVDHLLPHCDIALALWDGVLGRVELGWVMVDCDGNFGQLAKYWRGTSDFSSLEDDFYVYHVVSMAGT